MKIVSNREVRGIIRPSAHLDKHRLHVGYKLKQGFGRLIRTEQDTGAVAILDNRAGKRGAYRDRVLSALPDCRVTNDIGAVAAFIQAKKSPDYFTYSQLGNTF